MTNRSLKRGKRLVYLGIGWVNTTSKNPDEFFSSLTTFWFDNSEILSESSRARLLRLSQTTI